MIYRVKIRRQIRIIYVHSTGTEIRLYLFDSIVRSATPFGLQSKRNVVPLAQ